MYDGGGGDNNNVNAFETEFLVATPRKVVAGMRAELARAKLSKVPLANLPVRREGCPRRFPS